MKKLFSGILFTQGLNLLVKPLYLLWIDREVQNRVSPEEYGGYFAVLNLTLIGVVLLDPGIHNFVIRSVASNREKSKSYFISGLVNKGWLTGLYAAVIGISAWALDLPTSMMPVVVSMIMFQIFASYIQYFRSIFTALERFKSDGVLSVAERALTMGLMAMLLFGIAPFLNLSVQTFSFIQAVSAGIVVTIAAVAVFRLVRTEGSAVRIKFKSFLASSWPYALLTMLMGVYSYLDGVMLNQLAPQGAKDAAEYAMGYRLYFAGFMFAQLFAAYLYPVFSRMVAEGNSYSALAKHAFRVVLSGTVMVVSLGILFKTDIIEGLYPQRFTDDSVMAFSLLIAGLVANGFTFVFGTALTAEGKLRLLNQLAGITVMLNVVLNGILIPMYGASGAAVATLFSQSLFGVLCYIFCVKGGYASSDLKGLALIFLSWLISITGFYLLSMAFSPPLACALAVSIGAVSLSLLGVIQPAQILKDLKISSKK